MAPRTKHDKVNILKKIKGQNVTGYYLNGIVLLRSYYTPVAWADDDVYTLYITKRHYSVTTSRHIQKFINTRPDYCVLEVPQEDIDMMYINILQGKTPDEYEIINKTKKDRFDDLII